MDFGYAILPEFTDKGYATEALTALISYCFNNLKVKKIFGDCIVTNIASQKVMLKAGLKLFKQEKVKMYFNGEKG